MLARLLLREETYAHDSLRTNYVSKLAMTYERDLGVTHDLNGTLRTGKPFRSDLVTQHMAFVGKAGVEVSQAPALLHRHLAVIIAQYCLCVFCLCSLFYRDDVLCWLLLVRPFSVCFPCSSPIPGLIWFGSVYLVTTAGFVADQLM